MITILGQSLCGETIRCMQHCELAELPYETLFLFLESKEAVDTRYNKDEHLPQIVADGVNIGGFADLIKRYPI